MFGFKIFSVANPCSKATYQGLLVLRYCTVAPVLSLCFVTVLCPCFEAKEGLQCSPVLQQVQTRLPGSIYVRLLAQGQAVYVSCTSMPLFWGEEKLSGVG